jgi:parallel beta-helix repeat protein
VNDIFRLEGELDSPYDYLDIAVQKSRDEVIRDHQKKPDHPVENIKFRNLYAGFSEQNGFNLIGSQNINIIGCYITMIGNYGVNLGGVENARPEVGNPRIEPHPGRIMGVGHAGQTLRFLDGCRNCRVAGCDVYSVGADGIMLHGANNVAENNHVYECGLFDKDMANINAFGEYNIISRNTLHDTPRSAAFMKGVDNVIEYNDIRYTQLEARDGGAIRMCQRNIKIRGNVVRYNLIRDTIGYGHESDIDEYYCPWYSWGIYMDDFTSGSLIYGNIIARAARSGIMIHGGHDCEMYNNIVAYAPWGFETARKTRDLPRDQWQAGTVWKNNIFYYDRIKMAGKRHEYGLGGQALSHGVHEDIIRSDKNLYWAVGEDMKMQIQRKQIDFSEWQAEGWDQNSIVADPQFVDPEKDDFRLEKTSPAFKLGFTETDHSRIGCYQSDERLTWPLQNVTLPQEIPYVPSKQKLSR